MAKLKIKDYLAKYDEDWPKRKFPLDNPKRTYEFAWEHAEPNNGMGRQQMKKRWQRLYKDFHIRVTEHVTKKTKFDKGGRKMLTMWIRPKGETEMVDYIQNAQLDNIR